ncbi:unnamed protein product [Boreogadus saida]
MKSFPEKNLSWGAFYSHLYCSCVHTPVDDSPSHNPTGSNWSSAPNPLRTTPTQLIDGNAPIHVLSDPGKDREDSVDTRLFSTPPFLEDLIIYTRGITVFGSPGPPILPVSGALRARHPTGQAHQPSEVVRVWPGFRLRSILTDLIHYKTLLFFAKRRIGSEG